MSRLNDLDRLQRNMNRQVKGGKIYRTVSTIAIIGVFAAIAVLVFGLSYLGLSPAVFGIAITIGILCLSLLTALPWVRRIEDNKNKKVSFAFLILIGVCALLWVIAIWATIILIYNAESATETFVATIMLIVKIALILSTQLLVSSFIGNMIMHYGKELIVFQVITSLAYLFIDFYFTFIFFNIIIHPGASDWISVGDLSLLGNKFMITTLILSIAFASVSSVVIKSVETRRMMRSVDAISSSGIKLDEDYVPIVNDEEAQAEEAKPTPEQRLEKLKSMYEQNLITEEEYNQKRADILKEM